MPDQNSTSGGFLQGLKSLVSRARSAIVGGVRQGLSSLGITSLLQRTGLAPPPPPPPVQPGQLAAAAQAALEAEVSAAVDDFQGQFRGGGLISGLPIRAPIPESLYSAAKGRIRGRFQLTAKVTLEEPDSEGRVERFVVLATDRSLSPGEAVDMAALFTQRYGLTAVDVEFEQPRRAGILGSRSLRERDASFEGASRVRRF